MELSEHWDKVYNTKETESLGWYEANLEKSLALINETGLGKNARILHIGAGTTTLIDEMLAQGFDNMIAIDISKSALDKLQERVGANKVECIVGDLSNPKGLNNIEKVHLWFDRAVLHFLTKAEQRDTYFSLLKEKVKSNGFVVLAQFAVGGAEKCSGLPIMQYSIESMQDALGHDFKYINGFDYTYVMPSGAKRAYVYGVFQKR